MSNNFKVGDKVRVDSFMNSRLDPKVGVTPDMIYMLDREYVVESVSFDGHVYINDNWLVHKDDVTLIEVNPFLESMLNGEKICNPTKDGIANGEFIGYAVKFQNNPIYSPAYAILDKNGKSVDFRGVHIEADIQFAIQPEKKKMHSVAYVPKNVLVKHHWNSVIMSDEQLNSVKDSWSEYKILETWYE